MTFDRDQLIADYAQQILDGMDMKTMECFVYDTLIENLSTYSDQTLMEHISEYSPELLGDVPVEGLSTNRPRPPDSVPY
jgi:hypothetical protein